MNLSRRTRSALALRRHQTGLTIVELMVAVALGMLVAVAAIAALIIARQGFSSVDSSAQLRENTRFAASLVQRVLVQAGFENLAAGNNTDWKRFCSPGPCGDVTGDMISGVRGFDNAMIYDSGAVLGAITLPVTGLAHANRASECTATDTSCANGSDVLLVRYWGDGRAGAAGGDGSMINCAGMAESEGTAPAYSIFHVVRSTTGEPTLACTYRDPTSAAWQTVPLVQGVEGFQVLYGVDNVTKNTAPPLEDTGTDSVPDLYLSASEIDVSGNAIATADNWRRVRSVRVGLLVRGAANSAIDRSVSGGTQSVLGAGFTKSADVGSALAVPADGRLRQSVVFTVHLRNPQFKIPPRWN
jgi:type IV pilus assembly protein PilW